MTLSDTPDDQLGALMHAAQRGDSTAYHRLLCTITPRIRRIVAHRRAFAGREDVEDLVQDVLLSLHTVRATYDPARPFMPWLLAIVRNRLADGARRHGRRSAREVLVDNIAVTFAASASNSTPDISGDLDALDHALQALPVAQRQAIELLKLRELSLKEAAAVSGATIGALKVATHRAIAALRRALGAAREH